MTLAAVHSALEKINPIPVQNYRSFDENDATKEEFISILKNMSKNARSEYSTNNTCPVNI